MYFTFLLKVKQTPNKWDYYSDFSTECDYIVKIISGFSCVQVWCCYCVHGILHMDFFMLLRGM